MKLTHERETAYLVQYDPLLRSLAREYSRKFCIQGNGDTEDLLQEARVAFLLHLRQIEDESEIACCRFRILGALYEYSVHLAPLKIPKYCYGKEIRKLHRIRADVSDIEHILPPVSDEHITFQAEKRDFMDTLSEDERTVLRMKEEGCNNLEIIPVIHATSESQMSRFIGRLKAKLNAYFDSEGEDRP